MTQHFGSRLAIQARVNDDYEIEAYTVKFSGLDGGERPVIDALEYLNRPAKPEFLAGKIARLRVAMARRTEGEKDFELLIDTMMTLCRDYPADVVAWATDQWLRTKKFFPLPKEFIGMLDERVALRRALLAALRGDMKALARPADPVDWKDLPRERWDEHMWAAYVGDAEAMLALAHQNPSMMDSTLWEAEVSKRKAEIPAGQHGNVRVAEAEARGVAENDQNAPQSV